MFFHTPWTTKTRHFFVSVGMHLVLYPKLRRCLLCTSTFILDDESTNPSLICDKYIVSPMLFLEETSSLFAFVLYIAAKTPPALLGIRAFSFRLSVEISETHKSARRSKIFISLHLLYYVDVLEMLDYHYFCLVWCRLQEDWFSLASWVYIKYSRQSHKIKQNNFFRGQSDKNIVV